MIFATVFPAPAAAKDELGEKENESVGTKNKSAAPADQPRDTELGEAFFILIYG